MRDPKYLCFRYLRQIWKYRISSKGLVTKIIFIFLTTIICTVTIPVLGIAPLITPAVPSLQVSPPHSSNLVQQAKALYDTGQFTEAVKVLQQAVSAFSAQGDRLRQAMTLSDLSLAYQQLSLWSDAANAIKDAFKALQAEKNNNYKDFLKIKAQILNTQGRMQLALGQTEEALTKWEQATTAYTQAGDQSGVARSLINQAQAIAELGSYRQALDTLKQANQKLQKQPDSPLKASGLRSLGNAMRVVGDLTQAHQILQQSLATAQRSHSVRDIAQTLLSLGNLARSEQNSSAASTFYQQAATASSDQNTRIQAQLNQLSLLVQDQRFDGAMALLPQLQDAIASLPASHNGIYARIDLAKSLARLRQSSGTESPSWLEISQLLTTAVQQAKSLGDQRAEAHALGALGGLYEQTHQWSDAIKLTQQALILAQAINAPNIGYRWQWQMGRLLKAQGDTKGAISAYTEAVENLKLLRNDLVGINPDIQFSFRDEVEPIYRQLVDLLLQSEQPSQEDLKSARQTIESLQLAELDNFFRVACLEGKPVQIDEVLDKQDPTAAAIYPIILPDRLAVILKLPKQPLRFYKTTIPQAEVEKIIEDLRTRQTQPFTIAEVQASFKQVYDWLLRPAEIVLAKSKVKTLVFILDGSLRNIPMAALYDGKQYLVQKYASALTPGLQLLAPKSLSQVKLRALTGGLSIPSPQSPPGFSSLPNVAVELTQIKTVMPTTELLNQAFTAEALVKQINSTSFPIVHLATHGQFSSQADKTFILTWNGRIAVQDLNNLLQNGGDQSDHNPIELLVLSACETATGDKRAALGLAGVAVRAGARSTIASLWTLDDKSTPLMTAQFYRELASRKSTKAEALRRAQVALLENSQYKRPRDWAAYVLVGNWL